MRKNVLILEDNKYSMEKLLKILDGIKCDMKILKAKNESDAYRAAMKYTIDVFILDIVLDNSTLGDASGINFAQKIRTVDKYSFTPIIFTTTLEDPKLYAFTDIHSFAYLEKPYEEEEAARILTNALEFTTTRDEEQRVFFRKEGLLYAMRTSDIVYIENYSHILRVQTTDEMYEMPYRSCKRMIGELDNNIFFQCSRTTIVNKNHVLALDGPKRILVMKKNKGQLTVGRSFLKDVKKILQITPNT